MCHGESNVYLAAEHSTKNKQIRTNVFWLTICSLLEHTKCRIVKNIFLAVSETMDGTVV